LRFFFGGLGFAPKEAKPIAAAMSGGEGEREGEMEGEMEGDIFGGVVQFAWWTRYGKGVRLGGWAAGEWGIEGRRLCWCGR